MLTVDKYLDRINKYNTCEKCIFREVNCAGGMVCYGGAPVEPYCVTLSDEQLQMSLRECISGISHTQYLAEKHFAKHEQAVHFFETNRKRFEKCYRKVQNYISYIFESHSGDNAAYSVYNHKSDYSKITFDDPGYGEKFSFRVSSTIDYLNNPAIIRISAFLNEFNIKHVFGALSDTGIILYFAWFTSAQTLENLETYMMLTKR